MFKKVKIRHTHGAVDLHVRSGESGDSISYEDFIDLRELDKTAEEEEKKSKGLDWLRQESMKEIHGVQKSTYQA